MSAEHLASPFRHLIKDRVTTARTFRHLLRDLLRETTYLPDPWLRAYWRSYVISRYRDYLTEPDRNKAWREYVNQSRLQPGQSPEDEDDRRWVRPSGKKPNRQLDLLNRARKELRRLARANCGHEIALFSLMQRAYGRTGPRRHTLLRDVWQNDIPETGEQLQAIIKAQFGNLFVDAMNPGKNDDETTSSADAVKKQEEGVAFDDQASWKDTLELRNQAGKPLFRRIQGTSTLKPKPTIPDLPQRIAALIHAQQVAPVSKRLMKITTQPQIPETNAWGRPFPAVRAKNIIADWLWDLKNLLLPPLPEAEFNRLRAMSRGDFDGLVTPKLPPDMPPLVKVREYDHVFRQPQRRQPGTIRFGTRIDASHIVAKNERAMYDSFLDDDAFTGEAAQSDYSELEYDDEDGEQINHIPLNAETIARNLIDLRGAHHLKANYLERLYRRLLDLTCMATEVEGRVRYEWGREKPMWRLTWEAAQRAKQRGNGVESMEEDEDEDGEDGESEVKPVEKRAASDAWMFGGDDDDSEIVTYGSGQPAKAVSSV